MKWQKYGAIQKVRHSGKMGRTVDKKMTKSNVGGGVAAKKCDSTHSKNNILRVTYFLNDPYDADLFRSTFYECIC